jgi:hypothetical protein
LELLLRGFGIGRGDEVILPPYTFIATLSSIVFAGATPVFADIDDSNYLISPASVEEKITDKTRAIVAVAVGGCPPDLDALEEIAKRHNVKLIVDAAQGVGAEWKGKNLCAYGDAASISCQNSKNLTSGEGGIITTNDDVLAKNLELMLTGGKEDGKDEGEDSTAKEEKRVPTETAEPSAHLALATVPFNAAKDALGGVSVFALLAVGDELLLCRAVGDPIHRFIGMRILYDIAKDKKIQALLGLALIHRISKPSTNVAGVSVHGLRERITVCTVAVHDTACILCTDNGLRTVGIHDRIFAGKLQLLPRHAHFTHKGGMCEHKAIIGSADRHLCPIGNDGRRIGRKQLTRDPLGIARRKGKIGFRVAVQTVSAADEITLQRLDVF